LTGFLFSLRSAEMTHFIRSVSITSAEQQSCKSLNPENQCAEKTPFQKGCRFPLRFFFIKASEMSDKMLCLRREL